MLTRSGLVVGATTSQVERAQGSSEHVTLHAAFERGSSTGLAADTTWCQRGTEQGQYLHTLDGRTSFRGSGAEQLD